jgi:hypothetical protein
MRAAGGVAWTHSPGVLSCTAAGRADGQLSASHPGARRNAKCRRPHLAEPDAHAHRKETDVVNESFLSDVRAPASARRAVEPVNTMLSETQVGMLALLVSEVVANGVLYGDHPSRIHLRGENRHGRVRIEVTNAPNGSRPQLMAGDSQCLGLQLVQQVAADWGHQTDGRETRVWFELDPLHRLEVIA